VIFYGRMPILARADEMIVVNDNNRIPANSTKSILIVEGCGGSGRSELIAEIARRWASRAPSAKLDALEFKRSPDQESGATAVTVLLGSMMRQFTNSVPGYKVSWARMSLMLLASVKPVSVTAPDGGEQEMLSRMTDASRDHRVLEDLLGWLMSLPLSIPVTAAGAVTVDVGPLAKSVTEQVVKRLSRSARRPEQRWQPTLSWFAPPGQEGNWHAAVRELIRFSRIAGEVAGRGQDSAQRLQADSLLMNAFLSDLAESAAQLHGRPYNFVLLIDNADCPAGEELLAAVARARREMFRWPAGLDPLAVIAAGGKPRVLDQVSLAAADSEPGAEDRPDVVRLRLSDLSGPEVVQLVGEYPWSATDIDPPAHVVAHLVYLLTGGHCLASRLVLRELQLDPNLAADLNRLLGTPQAGRGVPEGEADAAEIAPSGVAQRVLHVIAAGITPHGAVPLYLLHDLVSLCAARHRDEARRLRGRLLTAKVNREQLFSDVLWSHRTPDGRLAMVPVARHLLLRELAARPQSSLVSWESLFQDLRDKQEGPHEGERPKNAVLPAVPAPASDQSPDRSCGSDAHRVDRLHHLLAVGKAATVAGEMAALVPGCPEAAWLTWLDAITITPVPERLTPADLPEDVEGLQRNVFQLIIALQQAADPCQHTRHRLHELYSKISSAYTNMNERAPAHWQIIAKRAESFRVRANQIA
jgi:hypothetical protein